MASRVAHGIAEAAVANTDGGAVAVLDEASAPMACSRAMTP
jgi:hypothetical protein